MRAFERASGTWSSRVTVTGAWRVHCVWRTSGQRAPFSRVRCGIAAAAALVVMAMPSRAWAVGTAEPPVDVRLANGYWSAGVPRWFVSSKSDLGGIYIKPYFSVGYGLPHWIWAGVDLNGISTIEFGQVYAGIRASLPVFDLAFGARDTYSYWKNFMDPQATFTSDDLGGRGQNARYWAWE